MKDLAIYGAGGFGRETAWMIQEINQVDDQWNLVGFFDDGHSKGKLVDGLPVLGGITELNKEQTNLELLIAIADPQVRRDLVSRIVNRRVHFPTLVHPGSRLGAPSNQIGKGGIITSGVHLTTSVTVGDFCIVNLLTTIGHDVVLGSFVSIMPQCSLSGNVIIGEGTFIGSGARILQGIEVGKDCTVGAGAVVTKSVRSNSRVAGVPAHEI